MKKRKKKRIIINFLLFIIEIIFLPFNAVIQKNNNTTKIKKEKKNLNFKSRLLIKEIKTYINDNYVDPTDVKELEEQIKYLESVNKRDIDYLVKKAKERLELNFFYVKNKIYVKELSNNNSKDNIKKVKEKDKKQIENINEEDTIKISTVNSNNISKQTPKDEKLIKKNFDLEKWEKKDRKISKVDSNVYKVQKKLKINHKNNYNKFKLVDIKVKHSKNNSNLKKYIVNKEEKINTSNSNNNYLIKEEKQEKKRKIEAKKNNVNFNWNKKKKAIVPFILNRKKSKINTFAYFTNSQYKKIFNLDIQFKYIIKKYLNEINDIYTSVLVSIQILSIKNNFFNEKRVDTQSLFNGAVNDISLANNLISDAIGALEDMLNYLDNNIFLINKQSYDFKNLIDNILILKNTLVDLKRSIEQKDTTKVLKKEFF